MKYQSPAVPPRLARPPTLSLTGMTRQRDSDKRVPVTEDEAGQVYQAQTVRLPAQEGFSTSFTYPAHTTPDKVVSGSRAR